MNYDSLISLALSMLPKAYAPYSHFHVGAALLAGSGKIYTGANIENASYGATICAERNAIGSAVNAGERQLKAIAIVGGRDGKAEEFCPPCGICRQVMREFANPKECIVILAKANGEVREFTLEELLPESFGPEAL